MTALSDSSERIAWLRGAFPRASISTVRAAVREIEEQWETVRLFNDQGTAPRASELPIDRSLPGDSPTFRATVNVEATIASPLAPAGMAETVNTAIVLDFGHLPSESELRERAEQVFLGQELPGSGTPPALPTGEITDLVVDLWVLTRGPYDLRRR